MTKLFNISNKIYAVSTLATTIIGVGLFSLPYITAKVGLFVMIFYFLVLGILVILIHHFFGELALKTPDLKRLPGFASYYLGKRGEKTAFFSSIIGTSGAILAYLIVGGEFLTELLSPYFGGGNLIWTFVYFFLGASLIFWGIRAIAKIEFWSLIVFFIILFLIFLHGKDFINIENLFLGMGNWKSGIKDLFLPYGPIIFSLWGASLIPEIEEMLVPAPKFGVGGKEEEKKALRWIIPISILIPIFLYLFFIFLILGITGQNVTESALMGLRNVLGNGIVNLGLLFGLIATFTSFITLGLTLKNIFCYDLKIDKNLAWFISCFPPLILFLIGIRKFIPVISFIGGVTIGIDGILILLMYSKLKKNIIIFPLLLMLLGGIIYEIFYLLIC